MKTGWKIGVGWAAVTAVSLAVHCQKQPSIPNAIPMANEPVREIDDPFSGDRWLLERNLANPGGPGRLILAEQGRPLLHADEKPVIHAGERVIVEENSPVVSSRLEAVALSNGWWGSEMRVRLTIGGSVVRVIALAPGRAVFAEESGAWR